MYVRCAECSHSGGECCCTRCNPVVTAVRAAKLAHMTVVTAVWRCKACSHDSGGCCMCDAPHAHIAVVNAVVRAATQW